MSILSGGQFDWVSVSYPKRNTISVNGRQFEELYRVGLRVGYFVLIVHWNTPHRCLTVKTDQVSANEDCRRAGHIKLRSQLGLVTIELAEWLVHLGPFVKTGFILKYITRVTL